MTSQQWNRGSTGTLCCMPFASSPRSVFLSHHDSKRLKHSRTKTVDLEGRHSVLQDPIRVVHKQVQDLCDNGVLTLSMLCPMQEASMQKVVEWMLWALLCFRMVAYGKPWKGEERMTHWRMSESEILPGSWVNESLMPWKHCASTELYRGPCRGLVHVVTEQHTGHAMWEKING